MIRVSSVKKGHVYTVWTTETLEMILGELDVSMYSSKRKIVSCIAWLYMNFVFYKLNKNWTYLQYSNYVQMW